MNTFIHQGYLPTIGLEVHCQLNTKTKLFCGCSTTFGALPNHQTCPVCLGHPGVLPTLNQEAVSKAVLMALAVDAEIKEKSVFARKQYFYPDLPKGYQISQFDKPFCEKGKLVIASGLSVTIDRIHLEEDAGKSIHGDLASFVDLNRSGVPLIEIVTAPDIHSPEDAVDYLKRLRAIIRYLQIGDGNLEEGSFRCDANVSVAKQGDDRLGVRCEIKNLNSFKNIEKAIIYEIFRQVDVIESGQEVEQETRLFDAAAGKTKTMRSKEDSHDYRYFPDPDLGILYLSEDRIQALHQHLPELPENKKSRFIKKLGIAQEQADVITEDRDLAVFFERILQEAPTLVPKHVANWLVSEFLFAANEYEWDLAKPAIGVDEVVDLLSLINDGTISGKIAKTVFQDMIQTREKATQIVERKSLKQVVDVGEIEKVVKKVLESHSEQVQQYLQGKEKLLGFFVGQIMKISKGKFNPSLLNQTLVSEMEKRRTIQSLDS